MFRKKKNKYPQETHQEAAPAYSPVYTQKTALVWITLKFSSHHIEVVFAMDYVPSEVIMAQGSLLARVNHEECVRLPSTYRQFSPEKLAHTNVF